ncbi:UPF0755 protein [Alkalibaculum bacchi]|uniref:Endolytic murein transglycosylase n=2 Tax=Alkalibaculum bacchi TaxID=645887 RepID=A0A366IB65_9FIRM|nr:UPF0755 protein [Alkalibaculum bacchi]
MGCEKMILRKRILFIIAILLFIELLVLTYVFLLSPTNHAVGDSFFEVKSGTNMDKIARNLKEQDYIRSVLAFKLHLRLNHIDNFKAGNYNLKTTMNAKNIAHKLSIGDSDQRDIKVTFPEGKTLVEMAEILSHHTDFTKEQIIQAWNEPDFIDQIINEFDFITEEIKNPGISYPLNGYLFPDTYYIKDKNTPPQDIALKLIQRMEQMILPYSDHIDAQNSSVHEILTLASIVEYEAKWDEDRPLIAGVFHNRLKNNMRLESCATLEMALGVHKEVYTHNDIRVDSPYNTYQITGIPIGPGNNPGHKSIEACLFPKEHSYFYFLSDIYGDGKTYYSKTLTEHNALKAKYLSSS